MKPKNYIRLLFSKNFRNILQIENRVIFRGFLGELKEAFSSSVCLVLLIIIPLFPLSRIQKLFKR